MSYLTLPPLTPAERLTLQGWTPAVCRERMAGCRENARVFRLAPDHTRYSLRYLNVAEYERQKRRLAILTASL